MLTFKKWRHTYTDVFETDDDAARAAWTAAINKGYSAGVQDTRELLAAQSVPTLGETNTDNIAVDTFAQAMKEKMADAHAKGRSGWECMSPSDLSRMLREHVEKGDPRDVANFCMMLWYHGARIAPQSQAAEPKGMAEACRKLVELRHSEDTCDYEIVAAIDAIERVLSAKGE